MRAVLVESPGGIDQLLVGEIEKPTIGKEEILIRVRAAGVNRADLMQREGKYPPPPGESPILGLEVAGTVEQVGEKTKERFRVGDRVCALLGGGGYAEYAAVHADCAFPIPHGLTFVEAAAIPEAFLTAYQALFWIGKLRAGETVCVHAAASGVGLAALQLVRAAGAIPIATVRSEEKRETCRKWGAEKVIHTTQADFASQIKGWTTGRGADVILDFVGASYFAQNVKAIALDGRWVLISTLGGSRLTSVSLGLFLQKRIQLTATTLRSRDLKYKSELIQAFWDFAEPLWSKKELQPVLDQVYKIEEVQAAHQYMENNRNQGKIVLSLD
jgi:putative PIG3 family NAD(P)H quinone oxidoreductase